MAHPSENSAVDLDFYQPADAFFQAHRHTGLTFDDITLATRLSNVLPRATNLATQLTDRLELPLPIISSDMDTVTEADMAIAMARNGGLGLIHYNMSERQQLKEVTKVKNDVHGLIQDPITVPPEVYIGDVIEMVIEKDYKFRTFPVVETNTGRFVGLLRGRIVKERYRHIKVSDAMTPRADVLTINEKDIANDPINVADDYFTQHMGIHKLIVIDDDERIKGLFTMSDIERIREEESASVRPARDAHFRLLCGAAISATRTSTGELDDDRILAHAAALVDEGIDAIAVSTAHGHSAGVGDVVKLLRSEFPELNLIAGNVTSAEGVEFLAKAGADAVKIGQGPGSICTTRIVAGVGIPQMTALYVCSKAAQNTGVRIIADGGITKSGDMVKALSLANAVMCGSILAGAREAPGRVMEINGKVYKQYRGMGSHEAMRAGSAARYGHSKTNQKTDKVAAEGIEALKEISGTAEDVLRPLVGGVQSGLGYLGAANLAELRKRARYIRVSPAGQRESSPHDVIEVKTTSEDS